jgi:hypothetical protein
MIDSAVDERNDDPKRGAQNKTLVERDRSFGRLWPFEPDERLDMR